MLRGTEETSGSALSQSPGAGWSITRRNGGTAVPPTRCMTLAVSLQLPCASVSPGQAFRESVAAGVEEPRVAVRASASARAVFAWRRCLAVILVSELCHVLVPWGTLNVAVWLLQVVNNPLPSAQGTR